MKVRNWEMCDQAFILIVSNLVKVEQKKSDELYIEHARMMKETQMLEKLLGIHCTIDRKEDEPYFVKVNFTFKEQQFVKLLFNVEYGVFACKCCLLDYRWIYVPNSNILIFYSKGYEAETQKL